MAEVDTAREVCLAGDPIASPAGLGDRILRWAADERDASASGKLIALRTYLMLHAAVELSLYAIRWNPASSSIAWLFAAGLALCLALSFARGRGTAATVGATAFLLGAIVWLFPGVSNHFFLIFVSLALLALLDLDDAEQSLLGLQALRWVTAIVLFYTGFQKVLYGTYFHGEFLAWEIATSARFADLFGMILPAHELERLRNLGDGPFRTEWLPLLLISNGVYVFEMAAPIFLMLRRTRSVAVVAVVTFLILLELGARELMFGAVFVNMTLLFGRRNYNRLLLPVFAVLFVCLLAMRLGLLPGGFFN